MKRIIKRQTGKEINNCYEARALVKQVKSVWPMVQSDDHRAPHGRPTDEMARRFDLRPILEAHDGYISVFQGAEDCGFEGKKALFIGFVDLPENFESRFRDYVVVGE